MNLCTEDVRSPLRAAFCNGHESTVQLLLKNGAEVNLSTEDGRSPLSIRQLVIMNMRALNTALKWNYARRTAGVHFGQTWEHCAALNNGAKVNLCNKGGFSPLYKSFQKEHEALPNLRCSKHITWPGNVVYCDQCEKQSECEPTIETRMPILFTT